MKKSLQKIFGIILLIILAYAVVFGRALKQKENHFAIAAALPKVMLSSKAARVENKTYLAKNTTSFVELMKKEGFTYIEQLGSSYFFEKDGARYVSTSRQYSTYFLLFSYPVKN